MNTTPKVKPDAAPRGWIKSGHCGFCLLPIECWHPVDILAQITKVRHVADKVPYRGCKEAKKAIRDL